MFSQAYQQNIHAAKLAELQAKLGYTFKDIELLKQALTRQSALEEGLLPRASGSYQRLEIVGDSVLALVIVDVLFEYHPDWNEGQLTTERSKLVSNKNLPIIAKHLDLGKYLIVGNGEKQMGIQNNPKALADAVEAVLGAIYRDSKCEKVARKFILQHWTQLGLKNPYDDQLIKSIQDGDVKSVNDALEKGANANCVISEEDDEYSIQLTRSMLQIAATSYHPAAVVTDIVSSLLKHNADVNWQGGVCKQKIYSASSYEMTVSEILKIKSVVEETLDKNTVLHLLVQNPISEQIKNIITLLVITGKANLNLQNKYGNTPLHIVASESLYDNDFYDFLISLGAKDDIENESHKTPKAILERKNQMLIELTADVYSDTTSFTRPR